MNYSTNSINPLRLEIAICQEDIDIYAPKRTKFTIPALLATDIVGSTFIRNSNVVNKQANSSIGLTTMDNTVRLDVPKEYTRWYGTNPIPKGTKFIVAFIGGNINDAKIIGRYDSAKEVDPDDK